MREDKRKEGWRWSVKKHQHFHQRLRKRESGARLKRDERGGPCKSHVVKLKQKRVLRSRPLQLMSDIAEVSVRFGLNSM